MVCGRMRGGRSRLVGGAHPIDVSGPKKKSPARQAVAFIFPSTPPARQQGPGLALPRTKAWSSFAGPVASKCCLSCTKTHSLTVLSSVTRIPSRPRAWSYLSTTRAVRGDWSTSLAARAANVSKSAILMGAAPSTGAKGEKKNNRLGNGRRRATFFFFFFFARSSLRARQRWAPLASWRTGASPRPHARTHAVQPDKAYAVPERRRGAGLDGAFPPGDSARARRCAARGRSSLTTHAHTPHHTPRTQHSPFVAAFAALVIAQVAKVLVHHALTAEWRPDLCWSSGGMPSSHTAAATALAAAIGMTAGVSSEAFAIAVTFAGVVCYDASGVRLHAGRTASVLNLMLTDLPTDHPAATAVGPSGRLREALGHTPVQVAAGAGLGAGLGGVVGLVYAAVAARKAATGG